MTRDGYEIPDALRRVQLVEIDMLKKLLEVCRRHHLRVWLSGGSMLGAVRHKGMIPWDDDIDVNMPRPDYDKLIHDYAGEFGYPYLLQSAYTDRDYFRNHAQVRNRATTGIRPSDVFYPFCQGIFIDIFPYDGAPDDPAVLHRLVRHAYHTSQLLKTVNLSLFYSGRWSLVFRKMKARWMVRKYGFANIFAKMEDTLRRYPYDTSARVGSLTANGDRFIYPREYFELEEVPFEDFTAPVPKGWDKILRRQYGDDYMTPKQQPSSHGSVVFDTEHPFEYNLPRVKADYKHSLLRRFLRKL